MSKQPIILKKDDSTRSKSEQKKPPAQPKILIKSNNKENAISTQPPHLKKDPEIPSEIPSMKEAQSFISPHFNLNQKVFDYLDSENSDFLVVAAIGSGNVGKSTLLNMIADQNYLKVEENGNLKIFNSDNEIFNTKTSQNYEGSSIDLFITTDRIFLLDPSPLLRNLQRRDMIMAESDDLKMLLMLFQLCHVIVVVHNGYPDMSLLRVIHLAEMMVPFDVKHRPCFIYVGEEI